MTSFTALSADAGLTSGILMIGLDGSGKTTILYKLKFSKSVTTISTIGFNAETLELNNCLVTLWDIGGHRTIRTYWKSFLKRCKALIFVIDSTKKDRFPECRKELENMFQESEVLKYPILVLANKQDLPEAASTEEISDSLGLPTHQNLNIKILKSSGKTSDGLYEGLEWVTKEINR